MDAKPILDEVIPLLMPIIFTDNDYVYVCLACHAQHRVDSKIPHKEHCPVKRYQEATWTVDS